jgi:hypothetical protein
MFVSEIRLLASITGAGVVWIADIVTASAANAPEWLEKYGLPGLFLALCVYAVRTLFAANQAMQREALLAKDLQIKATEETSKVFLATTRELIDATNHQTTQLEKLTGELKKRPCQIGSEP